MFKEKGLLRKIPSIGMKNEKEPMGESVEKDLEWPKGVVDAADRNINDILKRYPLVVVDCWAPWCKPCRVVGPIIERLEKTHRGKILFCKLNIDRNRITPKKHHVKSVPTILIFKNGEVVDRHTGLQSRSKLEKAILKHL